MKVIYNYASRIYTTYMEKYVLLVEDDMALQKAYQIKFEVRGVPFRSIHDGKEMMVFLKQNEQERPGAVVLDLLLPYVSGFELLEEMRKTKGWETIPVVIVSNVSDAVGLEKAESLGVKHYYLKTGINLDEAITRIVGYMEGHE